MSHHLLQHECICPLRKVTSWVEKQGVLKENNASLLTCDFLTCEDTHSSCCSVFASYVLILKRSATTTWLLEQHPECRRLVLPVAPILILGFQPPDLWESNLFFKDYTLCNTLLYYPKTHWKHFFLSNPDSVLESRGHV